MINAHVLRGQSASLPNSLMSIKTTHCGFTLALIKIIKDFVYIIDLFLKKRQGEITAVAA